MDHFDVERSYAMKKFLSIKGVHITTNIPEKAYITSGTSTILTLVTILHFATPPL